MSFQQRWTKITSLRMKHAMNQESSLKLEEEEGIVRPFKTMTRRLLFPAEFISDDDFEGPFCMVYPETGFKSLWDVSTAVFIGLQATMIPLTIAFSEQPVELDNLDFAMQAFFSIDILINFNLAFYELGALVTSRIAIAKRYLLSWFIFDIIATFPNELVICGQFSCDASNLSKSFRLLRFFKMFRLVRLAKLNSILFTIEDVASSRMLATIILAMKLILILFIIAHWLACFWIFIAYYSQEDYPLTWIAALSMQDSSQSEIYVTALYWALTTTISVGYGDVKPVELPETNVCLLSMIFSSVMFAYLLGSVTAFVAQQSELETTHRERFLYLSTFMKCRDIPKPLRLKATRYLNYLLERRREQPIDENNLIKRLSRPLRSEIYSLTRGPVFLTCSIFPERFDKQIQILSELLTSEIFAPFDIVFDESELSSSMYFIKSGEVEIYQKKTSSAYKTLGEGHHFGDLAYFSKFPRCASARCRFYTELLRLDRNHTDEAFKSIPDAIANMRLITDRLREEDYSILNIECYICENKDHVANCCPEMVFISNKDEIKRLWLKSKEVATKRINTNDLAYYNDLIQKTGRNLRLSEYSIRNVTGIAREVPFKSLTLAKKSRKYIRDIANLDSEMRYGRRRPKFTLLFGHDSDQEVEETTPSATFGGNSVSSRARPPTVLFNEWAADKMYAMHVKEAWPKN